MRTFISTRAHGVLDYIIGIVTIASPWLFGFANLGGASLFFPIVFGVLQLIMVMFTNHEGGFIKVVPIQLHLVLDVIIGFTLFIIPFLYGFYHFTFLPNVIIGLLLMGAGIFTDRSPLLDNSEAFDARGI